MVISRKTTTFANVIEIDRHIEILLLSNDCVIVPGFGGFTAHHVDARYDGRDNMFLPPLRTIGFNPQLTMNDSLLAQSYAETYDISYPEAINRIAKETAEMREVLESKGWFGLSGIGTLHLNEEGKYTFQPFEAGILTPELYGLGGFDIHPVTSLDSSEEIDEDFLVEESIGFRTIPLGGENKRNTAPEACKAMEDEEEGAKPAEFVKIKKSLLRNLAAACIALIAFFALSTPLNTPDVQKSQIDPGLLTRVMPKDITVTKNIGRLALTKGNEAENDATSPKESLQDDEKTDINIPYYSIVLASRITKHNAATYAERLQEKGLKAARVLITPSNVKVIYGTFGTETQAYEELNRLSSDEVFADGWVTKVSE